jgi:hypothetical protein
VSDGAIYAILPFVVVLVLGAGFWVAFRQRAAARTTITTRTVAPDVGTPLRDPRPSPARPWWDRPWLWVGACAVFLALGLLVWPGLFGGVFLFLPFVWVRRPRRTPTVDPRSNGRGTHAG